MTTPTSPMTKLDAVNQMLASIGQAAINTLTGTLPKDASKAVLTLDTILREVLNRGWSFNTDFDYVLTPDGNNNLLVPANALWIDPEYQYQDYVVRWDSGVAKLYDRENQTFTITSEVKCRVIWAYDFEEIPQVFRHWIAMRAGRIFQSQIVGSEILFQFTSLHEQEAYASVKRMEKRSKRYNMIANDPTAFRHYNPIRY